MSYLKIVNIMNFLLRIFKDKLLYLSIFYKLFLYLIKNFNNIFIIF